MEIIQQNETTSNIGKVNFSTIDDALSTEKLRHQKIRIPAPYTGVDLGRENYVPVSLQNTMLSSDRLMQNLLKAKNAEEINNIIGSNLDLVISMMYKGSANPQYMNLLKNPGFVMVLKDKFSQVPEADVFTTHYINNMVYRQYLELDDSEEEILKLLKDLIAEVNKITINNLLGISRKEGITKSMSTKDAIYITMSRYSCPYEYPVRGIYRMNYAIANFEDADVYTEQMMVYIYEQMADSIVSLVIGTMFKSVEFGTDYSMCNQDVIRNQVTAVMSILNFQSRDMIRLALYEYANKFSQFGYDYNWLTIPMKQCDLSRYPLILSTIKALNEVNVDVP